VRRSSAALQLYDSEFQPEGALILTVRAEPETFISRAWVQSPDRAE